MFAVSKMSKNYKFAAVIALAEGLVAATAKHSADTGSGPVELKIQKSVKFQNRCLKC